MARLKPTGIASPPTVYFDDSGCNAKHEPDFLWAGYWASWKYWQRIGTAWNAILDRSPKVEYWHQAKVAKKEYPLDKITDVELRRKLRSLKKLISDNIYDRSAGGGMMPICIRVSHRNVIEHVSGRIKPFRKPSAILPRALERPHFIALYFAAQMCDAFQRDMGPEHLMPLSVYCEGNPNDPYQTHMHALWAVLRQHYPDRFASLDFPPGKSRLYPQFQIADMFASHMGKYGTDSPETKAFVGDVACDVTLLPKELESYVASWNRMTSR